MNSMVISLDTNIWIFGIRQIQPASIAILHHLRQCTLIIPDQVRRELEHHDLRTLASGTLWVMISRRANFTRSLSLSKGTSALFCVSPNTILLVCKIKNLRFF